MPLMTASQRLPSSAAMIPSKPVFLKLALTPISCETALPMSMSEPTGVEPCWDSSGGYVMSLHQRIWPADLMFGGGVTPRWAAALVATATSAAAARIVRAARVRVERDLIVRPFRVSPCAACRARAWRIVRLPRRGVVSRRLAADVRHLDLRLCRGLGRTELGIAVGAPVPERPDLVRQLLVGAAEAERGTEVVPAEGEQAG